MPDSQPHRPTRLWTHWWTRSSWTRRCLILALLSLLLVCCFVGFVACQTYREIAPEWAYFVALEDQDTDDYLRETMPLLAADPPPVRIERLFQDLVQLNSLSWKKSLRLYDDGTCEYPSENIWIYVAGNKTCPKSDGPEMCREYVQAYDRLVEYHHTKKPAAGAFLSYVDCDISPALCREWEVEANIMINMRSFGPCDVHMPDEGDPEYRFMCSVLWRFIGLPLQQMPISSLKTFPSAFEQLRSLTGVDGFVDFIDPLPDLSNL